MINLFNKLQDILDALRNLDFLAPLALRIYLAPVFWYAGTNKIASWESIQGATSETNNILENISSMFTAAIGDTAAWFGDPDWGLGLPMPLLLAALAISAEVFGAIFLILGFAIRWITIPLITTMGVALTTVHWGNGWQAILDSKSPYPPADIDQGINRLQAARGLLEQHGNYDWLTSSGSFVISNNGIEWSMTYLIMLLALFFLGGGKYFSFDYWIHKKYRN